MLWGRPRSSTAQLFYALCARVIIFLITNCRSPPPPTAAILLTPFTNQPGPSIQLLLISIAHEENMIIHGEGRPSNLRVSIKPTVTEISNLLNISLQAPRVRPGPSSYSGTIYMSFLIKTPLSSESAWFALTRIIIVLSNAIVTIA